MRNFSLCLTLIIFSVFSCVNNEESNKGSNEANDQVEENEQEAVQENGSAYIDSGTYNGFIGDAAITLDLVFDYDAGSVSGRYFYNKYKKNITLKGEQTDWYGGEIYNIEEFDNDGNSTGIWEGVRMNWEGAFTGTFKAKAEDNAGINIIFISDEMDAYIHPESKMIFNSKKEADNFFKKHHFLNNNTANKCGVIVINDQSKYDYSCILPKGIKLYEHDGGDGFGVEETGVVNDKGELEFKSGSTYSFTEFGLQDIEIGYEVAAPRFHELVDEEFVVLSGTGYNEVFLSIDELESKGYHLEGDGYWVAAKSGKVLGFFPAYFGDYESGYTHPKIKIYEEMSSDSKVLRTVIDDAEGYFSLQGTEVIDNVVWAEVAFDFHTEEPCGGDTYEFKPSILGYIPLYQYDEENNRKDLVLGYYSRGC